MSIITNSGIDLNKIEEFKDHLDWFSYQNGVIETRHHTYSKDLVVKFEEERKTDKIIQNEYQTSYGVASTSVGQRPFSLICFDPTFNSDFTLYKNYNDDIWYNLDVKLVYDGKTCTFSGFGEADKSDINVTDRYIYKYGGLDINLNNKGPQEMKCDGYVVGFKADLINDNQVIAKINVRAQIPNTNYLDYQAEFHIFIKTEIPSQSMYYEIRIGSNSLRKENRVMEGCLDSNTPQAFDIVEINRYLDFKVVDQEPKPWLLFNRIGMNKNGFLFIDENGQKLGLSTLIRFEGKYYDCLTPQNSSWIIECHNRPRIDIITAQKMITISEVKFYVIIRMTYQENDELPSFAFTFIEYDKPFKAEMEVLSKIKYPMLENIKTIPIETSKQGKVYRISK